MRRQENVRLGQLAVGLQRTGLIDRVLEDDVALVLLEVAQGQQNNVALVDPDLLAQLSADRGEALLAVEAGGVEAAVSEHLDDLGVLLAILLEGELTLVVLVLVLSATTVLSSLSLVLLRRER